MERKLYPVMAALVLVAGLVGGMVATWLGGTRGVQAQGTSITMGTVTAQELRVVDKQGRMRLRALVADDGLATFVVLDTAGQARVVAGVDANGVPAIGLADRSGTPRASLDLESGIPAFQIFDRQGNPRIYLGESNAGMPFLDITDQQGQRRIYLGQIDDGSSRLNIRDRVGDLLFTAPPPMPTSRPSPMTP